MTEKEVNVEALRAKLLASREALLAVQDTGDEAGSTVELDQSRVGRLSRMDAMQAQAVSQAASQRRDIELRQISLALARIDSGDYGYCSSCDELIQVQRLEANPSIALCLACASKLEA